MPLSAEGLGDLYENVIRAVCDSRGRFIEQHAVDMIGNTILDALSRSQIFRDAVTYGIHIQAAADRNG
ncbi:T3SS secreted effector NleC-like protein [Escherichia coli]|nr:T3SS secreted effector NleC-like protein [Escherichia coli]